MSIQHRFPFLVITSMIEENWHGMAAVQSMVLVENGSLHEAEYRIRFLDCDFKVVRMYHVPTDFDAPDDIKVEVK